MWLPDLGSLQTVVLLTPGKWAARLICLGIESSRSDGRVAVGGAAEAEQATERAGLVSGPEHAPPLQFWHQFAGDRLEVVREDSRAQPEAGQPGLPPVQDQVGKLAGGA